MTCKIKRKSLRCGGRPKADFGSLFTSVIAPALNATGSIVDESISNNKTITNGVVNSNTTIPSDPTKTPTMKLGGRKKCWIGAAIGAATSIAGSLFGNGAKKREMRRQKSIQDWQTATQEAANMTAALNNSQDYQEDYLRQFRTAARLGKTLGAKGIYITDGGDATKIGNNTYLLRGGSHEDVNETGQTGIGINVGGNEVEAEGGEVAQKKNGALRIFSAQPILSNGMSPAQAILRGYNKDSVFKQQQAFKKINGLKDDGSKAKHGTAVPYKRIHINEDGTFTDTLTGKNYNTSATNGEDVVITGKANHWKEAGKKDTSSYFDPMGAVKQPRREYDYNKVMNFTRDLLNKTRNRSEYRNKLIDMSRRFRRRNERYSDKFDVTKEIPIMDFDEPFRFGGRCKLRNGGWKAPVYNTKKYRVSNRMRQQIATWEGSDFAGQNRKFKGDAIGAKERELRQIMGRTYNYLTDNQRDSLNSIYYNSRVDTFKNRFGKWFRNLNNAVDRGNERAFNNSLAGIRQSMTIGENRQGMSGLAKRRAWERNWFGNPIPMDSKETKAILKQQAEARMAQPTDNTRVIIQPEYIEVPIPVGHGIVPVNNSDPNLLQGNIKDNLINMGNKFRLGQRCGGKTKMRCGGSTRMRKALGCESRPVKGMRSKLAWGDVVYPYRRNNNFDYWDIIDQEQKANDKGGITPWTTSNKYDVKVPLAITKSTPTIPYTTKVYTPTSKVTENKTSQNYNDNKSGMILRDADWYSLGADLIGTIGAGIIGAKAAGNTYIPEAPVRYQATKLNTNYNITPQLETIRRSRNRLANEISNNTSSSVAAINRLNLLENNANEQLNKLYDIKENRESDLLNQDALNQQSVSAQNVQAINDYNYRVAELKNARTQAMGNVLTGTLQGIGNSFQNLISQGRQNYDDTQAMLMGVAASDYATPSRLLELGVDVGDDAALAGIYRSAMNIPNPGARPKREDYSDNTEYSYALTRWENQNKAYQRRNSYANLIKGRMSKKNLIKYGII